MYLKKKKILLLGKLHWLFLHHFAL